MQNAKNILFIKLGEKGRYEKECIEEKSTIKLGYREINHMYCINGRWDEVSNQIQSDYGTVQTATTSHKNQIRKFYEEPRTTMWITFYNSKLLYSYADETVMLNSDGTKERKTIDGWHETDSEGNTLFIQFLSGRLTKVQGFRGTICDVKEKEYLLHKLNNTQSDELKNVEKDLLSLRKNLELLIKKLNHKDFEIFVDLLFRAAGWSRMGHIGSTIKTLDIELLAPVTNERAVIQVKSQSNLATFNEYKIRLLSMNEYDKYFFITHTPLNDLQQYIDAGTETDIKIYDAKILSELSINAGLIEWIINVAP
jgi:hypothetical protein